MPFAFARKSVTLFSLSLLIGLPAFAATPVNKALYEQAQQQRPEFVKLLGSLVNIDSGTGSEKGLDKVRGMIVAEVEKLGMKVELVSAQPPAVGSNIVATLTGKGKGKILLMTHMDTVFADGSAAARPFRVEGNRAYGPGVVDDKGGVVTALFAIKLLQQSKFTDFAQITLLVNSNEETFSKGSYKLIETLASQHDVTLSLEGGRPADGLVVWRKGSGTPWIDVKGKASHAGNNPAAGRNAAMEAAHQMLQMASLGDTSKETTVNFTVLHAGDRTNVIPDAATVRGDMRARTPEEFDRVEKDMARLAEKKLIAGTEVKTGVERGMAPWPLNPSTEALAARAQAIYGELGMKLTMEGSGGAGDANYTGAVGARTLDGFGIVGGGFHGEDEYADLNSIGPRLYLLVRMIMDSAGK
jgi:glutamate carboxypeptidase